MDTNTHGHKMGDSKDNNKQTNLYWLIHLTGLWPPVKNRVIGGVPVVGGASGG